ncbi:hypothetical protein BS50DRAFT_638039 [Corynespora cassiicola Philippines]|uniref:Uncharacterized protein n=1 Tax=Corynespora cassiicola Philippines TaxID=1448308 RepID=A0A2T2NAE8_CORCC|nr:hypothetical protein BS50DRAFT_638039 [Corynespora cassiicola Philippines]
MAINTSALIFCDNIGIEADLRNCCTLDDQSSPACRQIFADDSTVFTQGCNGTCVEYCRKRRYLYSSLREDLAIVGNGQAPVRHHNTCSNVPQLSRLLSQGALSPEISTKVQKFIPQEITEVEKRDITFALTDCLTATCEHARNRSICGYKCSGVNLIGNDNFPNLQGMNECINALCTGDYDSLPFADDDIVGIGVFSSYILQCVLVVLFCFVFIFHDRTRTKKSKHQNHDAYGPVDQKDEEKGKKEDVKSHREIFAEVLEQLHLAQCFFSGSLQIASLCQGIFSSTDLLFTFLLIPLATNGALPVVFTYFLLFRWNRADLGITIHTILCWLLSTIVYWTLYEHLIPFNHDLKRDNLRYRAYQQFFFKLSAIQACGDYSALAVCPGSTFNVGRDAISSSSRNLRVLTPIIWSFATFCFAILLAVQLIPKIRSFGNKILHNPVIYWLFILCFLAGMGIQLSLLSIGTSLKMMDPMDWSFGQIVAVIVWIPIVWQWAYVEFTARWPGETSQSEEGQMQ